MIFNKKHKLLLYQKLSLQT